MCLARAAGVRLARTAALLVHRNCLTAASPLPQVLEQRGLVVKHPLVVKRPQGKSHFTSHVQTNILHLPRFAPADVGRGVVMTVRLAATGCGLPA